MVPGHTGRSGLVQGVPVDTALRFGGGGLAVLVENKIAGHQTVHFGAHETTVCIQRRHDYRFSPYIEAGINDEAIAGQLFESGDQPVVAGIGLFMNGL